MSNFSHLYDAPYYVIYNTSSSLQYMCSENQSQVKQLSKEQGKICKKNCEKYNINKKSLNKISF